MFLILLQGFVCGMALCCACWGGVLCAVSFDFGMVGRVVYIWFVGTLWVCILFLRCALCLIFACLCLRRTCIVLGC